MPNLTFRDATPEDIPIILTLSHAGDARGADAPPLDPTTFSDPRYREAFDAIAADPRHRLIIAEYEGEVAGTLQISIIPGLTRMGQPRGMLEDVHIRTDLRGKGLGTEMIEWAIAYCRDQGCALVQLTSNKLRTDAHRFYRKLGFVNTHEGFKLVF